MGGPQHVPVSEAVAPQVQGITLPVRELQEGLVIPFLQLVEVP